jgi:hypothetical protein
MIDFGGAKHWEREAAKLAPQTISLKSPAGKFQTYHRLEYGGGWMSDAQYQEMLKDRARKAEEREQRIKRLETMTEWYKMSEDERIRIGNELYKAPVTPESGWTRESAITSGLVDKNRLEKYYSPDEPLFDFLTGAKRQDILDPNVYYFNSLQKNLEVTDPNLTRFLDLAEEGGYAGRNTEFDKFVNEQYQLKNLQTQSSTPQAIEKAKQAQREEKQLTVQRSSRSTAVIRKKSPLQINTTEENSQLPDETLINIPS